MPAPGDQPKPSIQESSVGLPLSPVMTIAPYKEDVSSILPEAKRARNEWAQLSGFYMFERQAYEQVLPPLGAPVEIMDHLKHQADIVLIAALDANRPDQFNAYRAERQEYFQSLRSEAKLPEPMIRTLEAYATCMQRAIRIIRMKPAGFAVAINKGNIPIREVTEKVRNAWIHKDDVIDSHDAKEIQQQIKIDNKDLVDAIGEQIIAEYQTKTPVQPTTTTELT